MRIAITRADGGVSIMNVAEDASAIREVMRHADFYDGTPMAYVSHRVVLDDQLPQDRTFRNAWTDAFDTPTIDVDMPKARDIVRSKLREGRKPALQELDVAYQRADEQADADSKARIAVQKQALRDLPADPRIEEAQTPEELIALGELSWQRLAPRSLTSWLPVVSRNSGRKFLSASLQERSGRRCRSCD